MLLYVLRIEATPPSKKKHYLLTVTSYLQNPVMGSEFDCIRSAWHTEIEAHGTCWNLLGLKEGVGWGLMWVAAEFLDGAIWIRSKTELDDKVSSSLLSL